MSGGTKVHLGYEKEENFASSRSSPFNLLLENLLSDNSNKKNDKTVLAEQFNENLYDCLNNSSSNEFSLHPNFTKKFDFSTVLQSIHLDDENGKDDCSSDKENEISNLSLAELFFKKETPKPDEHSSPDIRNTQSPLNELLSGTDNVTSSDSTNLDSSNEQSLISLLADLSITNTQNQADQDCLLSIHDNDFEVNLDLARKNSFTSSDPFYSSVFNDSLLYPSIDFDSIKLPKVKESLFCKVLCGKVRKPKIKTAPKLPTNLPDLLTQIGYYQHFTFDTPSPDDIVKEKQKHAFKKY